MKVIKLLLITTFIVVFGFITVPNFLEPRPVRIAPVISGMRTMGMAIESYFVDHNRYPAATTDPDLAIHPDNAHAGRLHRSVNGLHTLTTPVAYITFYPEDPFASEKNSSFHYWVWYPENDDQNQVNPTWIFWSPGPDRVLDLTAEILDQEGILEEWAKSLAADQSSHPEALIIRSYDPTNGIYSNGDLWRLNR